MRHSRAIEAIQSAIRSVEMNISREREDISRWQVVLDPPSAAENAIRAVVKAEGRIEGLKLDKAALEESIEVLKHDQESRNAA